MRKRSIMKRHPSAGPSRRKFMKTTLVGAIFAGAFSLSEAQAAKASKSAANYQNRPNRNQRCATCRFFQKPYSCQRVAGGISKNGWCKFYQP
jgi:hypothetical protein